LTALPVKSAGLALPNPVTSSAANYKNSTLMSSHLLLAVQGKTQSSPQDHRDTCLSSLSSIRELRIAENKSSLTKILSAAPQQWRRPWWWITIVATATAITTNTIEWKYYIICTK
jgi:hypothetical protein